MWMHPHTTDYYIMTLIQLSLDLNTLLKFPSRMNWNIGGVAETYNKELFDIGISDTTGITGVIINFNYSKYVVI